jgi:hypothetical protein
LAQYWGKPVLSLSKGGWRMRAMQGFANVTCSQ